MESIKREEDKETDRQIDNRWRILCLYIESVEEEKYIYRERETDRQTNR